MGLDKTLYTRQDTLKLKIPKSIVVIGVGGVGSHTSIDFALSGVPKIMIIDPDIVERSNLNRTPFKMADIGRTKVEAVMEYITERRNCDIIPVHAKVEDVDVSLFDDYELIVDCRDVAGDLPEELQKKTRITGGYDGMNITIHINPSSKSIWGEGATGYTIVPSWRIPPKLISLIIVTYVMASRPRTKEYIHNLNIKNLIQGILGVQKDEIKEVILDEIK